MHGVKHLTHFMCPHTSNDTMKQSDPQPFISYDWQDKEERQKVEQQLAQCNVLLTVPAAMFLVVHSMCQSSILISAKSKSWRQAKEAERNLYIRDQHGK